MHEYLLSIGFKLTTADTCVYSLDEVLLLPYVDDIQITGSDTNSIDTVIAKLKNRFEVVDLGVASYLLRLTIVTRRQDQNWFFARNICEDNWRSSG